MSLDRIETERLILRPMTVADAEAMHAWASDKVTTQYMSFQSHASMEATCDVLRRFERLARSQPPALDRPLGIVRKDYGTLIGSTGLHQDSPSSVSTGWILAASQRGRKFAYEGCLGLFATAFAELPWLRTIHAQIHPDNHVSLGLALKLGFRPWGTVHHDYPQLGLQHFEVPQYRLLRP